MHAFTLLCICKCVGLAVEVVCDKDVAKYIRGYVTYWLRLASVVHWCRLAGHACVYAAK